MSLVDLVQKQIETIRELRKDKSDLFVVRALLEPYYLRRRLLHDFDGLNKNDPMVKNILRFYHVTDICRIIAYMGVGYLVFQALYK